ALAAAHNVLLAHGRSVEALRAHANRGARIGLACDVTPALPQTAADAAAAERATFASPAAHFSAGGWWSENAWWLDSIYRGAYPADALTALGADAPPVAPGDMKIIAQPLDFIAVNVYGGQPVRTGPNGRAERVPWPAGAAHAANGWQLTPEALYWAPHWLHQRYRLPVFVTENGCALCDWTGLDGAVRDPLRVDFSARYLGSLARAVAGGTPALGYLHWSLLDNFEWQLGYTQRFGLIYVDFPSQRRVLKDSAHWYARVIATRGASLGAGRP
ncbi:MAG TPA: family 1 glycosylhydrolase, partial [Terriglobales bacterium]|nr:family 1 glycosylhydrolase [Terriglobales bacterium]